MKRLLPIGSIVMLDLEKKEKVMIIGRLVRKTDDDVLWDYCGCIAPYGIQTPDQFKVFNHDEIRRLIFIGFQDEEELQYSLTLGKVKEEHS